MSYASKSIRTLAFGGLLLTLGACAGSLEMLNAAIDYEQANHPDHRTFLDLAYRSLPETPVDKHRLDLFLPSNESPGWPTLVFVHGGGWTSGDRAMGALGIEPIRNIGRFYAQRGYGVATISYRLQPSVTWREQLDDVAHAVQFVREEVVKLGGDPNRIILSGHSAGAWLAAWVGLGGSALEEVLDDASNDAPTIRRDALCALVLVSGAAYDITDEETYALGAGRSYFEERFGSEQADWAHDASIRHHVAESPPPALVMAALGEPPTFDRQGNVLFEAIRERERDRSRPSKRTNIPGQNHQRILISVSLEDDPVSEAILGFLESTACAP